MSDVREHVLKEIESCKDMIKWGEEFGDELIDAAATVVYETSRLDMWTPEQHAAMEAGPNIIKSLHDVILALKDPTKTLLGSPRLPSELIRRARNDLTFFEQQLALLDTTPKDIIEGLQAFAGDEANGETLPPKQFMDFFIALNKLELKQSNNLNIYPFSMRKGWLKATCDTVESLCRSMKSH